jgi:hypothetical protein
VGLSEGQVVVAAAAAVIVPKEGLRGEQACSYVGGDATPTGDEKAMQCGLLCGADGSSRSFLLFLSECSPDEMLTLKAPSFFQQSIEASREPK